MRVAICDDNREFVEKLDKDLRKLFGLDTSFEKCYTGDELIMLYETNSGVFDVIFLDMEMPGTNGIETANKIREMDDQVIIIFVTSYRKYMKKSFVCNPFDFMVKPVKIKELKEICERIQIRINKKRRAFTFYENKALVRLFYDDMLYLKCNGHKTWIYTKNEEPHKLCKNLGKVLENLDDKVFFRTNKSYAINLKYLKRVYECRVKLYGADVDIPLSQPSKNIIEQLIKLKEEDYQI